MCFAWISEQTAIISLYSINLSVFITEAECLLRGTNWVFKSDSYSFVLKGLILIAFPLQQWLHTCASIVRYTYIACLFLFLVLLSDIASKHSQII